MTGAPNVRPSKHVRPLVAWRMSGTGEPILVLAGHWSATKRRPWTVRAENRWKNKRARAARKANRPQW